MTATDLAPWIVTIGFAAIFATVAVLFVIAVRSYDPGADTLHTLDCLDWRERGERDTTCTAHHGTDWFGPRAQVEFEAALDHQIGVRRG